MKKSYKIVLNFGILFLILVFFSSCAIKPSEKLSKYPLIEGQTYKGKIWWKLEVYNQKEKSKVWGGYASFEADNKYLYLLIRGFLGGNLAFLMWELKEPQEVSIYDFKKEKVYIWVLGNFSEIKEFPMYFLGFKKEKKLQLNSLILNYVFFEKEQKGTLLSEQFKLEWQIKEIILKENGESLKEEVEKFSRWDIEVSPFFLQSN